MADLVMMHCDKLTLSLSTAGCARLFRKAQETAPPAWDPKAACRFCPIGAAHAGLTIAPMAEATTALKRLCPRCQRPSTRFIRGHHCISCYNRAREAELGKNAKGTRPALSDQLHTEALAVGEASGVVVKLTPRVANRVEAMLTLARTAKGPISFGAAPLSRAA